MMMKDNEQDRILAPGMLLSVLRNASHSFPADDYCKHLGDTAARLVERGEDVERFVDTVLDPAWRLYPLQVLTACDCLSFSAWEDIIRDAARSALVADLRDRMKTLGNS